MYFSLDFCVIYFIFLYLIFLYILAVKWVVGDRRGGLGKGGLIPIPAVQFVKGIATFIETKTPKGHWPLGFFFLNT